MVFLQDPCLEDNKIINCISGLVRMTEKPLKAKGKYQGSVPFLFLFF